MQTTYTLFTSNLQQQEQSTWQLIASIIYTSAWSISFYGQVYQNWKLKSVQGFSLDYLTLNLLGYTFYGIYTSIGYFTDIKGAGTVVIADLIFVYHAIPIVIIEAIQCCIYPRGKNKISFQAKIIALVLIVFVLFQFFMTEIVHVFEWTEYWNPVSALGYAKLIISFIKYTPAVYWNYKRKSTKGWSIFNIILDLVGGTFSLASGSISISNGLNVTKLFLAILTIAYDLIFVFQHYVLYRKRDNQTDKQNKNPLLKDGVQDQDSSSDKVSSLIGSEQINKSSDQKSNNDSKEQDEGKK